MKVLLVIILGCALRCFGGQSAASAPLFSAARDAYRVGDYNSAALMFHEAALQQPASGTLLNLGLAEWQRGQTGPAILAWEQSLWLNPFNDASRENLRFARRIAQLEAPDLVW